MLRLLLLLTAVGIPGALGAAVLPHSHSTAVERDELIFREDFKGRKLDDGRWRTCHWWANRGCTIATNNELEWYLPEQVRLGGNRAQLVAERRTVQGSDGRSYPYASGMISTGPGPDSAPPKFAFQYGRAAMRAYLPHGQGLWSAFWLLPVSRDSKPEIDVVELLGHDPRTVRMHLHYRGGDGAPRQVGHSWAGLSRGWHEFGIDWRPGRLTWLVDGKPRWEVTGDTVPDEPMYLVANLAVGGDWPGPPSMATEFPARMAIDWLKVWR